MVTLRMNARFLPRGHQVYVLHPGDSKVFYQDFLAQERVWLDLPGVDLPGSINWESDRAAEIVRYSQDVAAYHAQSGRAKDSRPRDRGDYSKQQLAGTHRSVFFSQVRVLYGEAKRGELVVVPGPGYLTHVYIGELIDEPNVTFPARSSAYPSNERIPARRVKWLHRATKKISFSVPLIEAMQNRRALTRLHRMEHRKEVYDLAYGNYTIGESGKSHIHMSEPSIDPRALRESTDLIVLYAALYGAVKKDEVERFLALSKKDPEAAINKYYDAELFIDTSVDIRSPGVIGLNTRKAAASLFVAAMIATTSVGEAQPPEGVKIVAEGNVESECEIEVAEDLKLVFEHMGADIYRAWCEKTRKAEQATGVHSTMTATVQTATAPAEPATKSEPSATE